MTEPISPEVARRNFLQRAECQLAEIDQYFADLEHWNNSRTPFERIDPDPDGKMQAMKNGLAKFIADCRKGHNAANQPMALATRSEATKPCVAGVDCICLLYDVLLA